MANIELRDLSGISKMYSSKNLENSVRGLSDDELKIQGGLLIDRLPPIGPHDYPEPWLPTPTH